MSPLKPVFSILSLCLACNGQANAQLESPNIQEFDNIRVVNLDVADANVRVSSISTDRVYWNPTTSFDQFEVSTENETLVLKHKQADCNQLLSANVSSSGSGEAVIIMKDIHISVENGKSVCTGHYPTSTLHLYIPENTVLQFHNYRGKAQLSGDFSVVAFSGSGKLNAGNVAKVDLNLNGNAKVTFKQVSETLSVAMKGNSRVTIKNGELESAKVEASGNSRFTHEGSIGRIAVDASGNARVTATSTRHPESIRAQGNARVRLSGR